MNINPILSPNESSLYYLSLFFLFSLWFSSYFIVIPVSAHLVSLATSVLFVGCHRSLRLLDHKAIPLEEKETITERDAYRVPIFASISLGLLYIAFKYLDKDTVNLVLSLYFCVVGIFALTATLSPIIEIFLKDNSRKFEFSRLGFSFTLSDFLAFVIATGATGLYFKTKHYMLNNLLGIAFCIQALERVSIGSYRIGFIILSGLFVYDIFWVFGTDVMVSVAKSFDAPIKLLFPRVLPTLSSPGQFSLLGLGDIVVPGIFISLLIRFDASASKVMSSQASHSNIVTASFPKPYFYTCLVAYSMGLAITVVVMYLFHSAQPALLYLVPMCLGSTWILGMWNQEMNKLWDYDEEKMFAAARKELEEKEEDNPSGTMNDNKILIKEEIRR